MRSHDDDVAGLSPAVVPVPDEAASEASHTNSQFRSGGASVRRSAVVHLQRAAGNSAVSGLLQRQRESRSPVLDVVAAGGSGLDAETRREMEVAFGHDFSGVRIHTGRDAAASARTVQASALTVGDDIVFGERGYAPDTPDGRHDLIHELAHVVQQRAGPVDGTEVEGGISLSDPMDPFEQAAETVARDLSESRWDQEGSGIRRAPASHPRGSSSAFFPSPAPAVSPYSPVVQRHGSEEHALLGDLTPAQLKSAKVSPEDRVHVYTEQLNRLMEFAGDAHFDPRVKYPALRWLQLGGNVWLSYGELNALPDYLPSPETVDFDLIPNVTIPVLQRMRADMAAALTVLLGTPSKPYFEGQAQSGMYEALPDPIGSDKAMDLNTYALGSNRYFGLLSRNACHFAPFSWHRWAAFHNEARQHAWTFWVNRSDQTTTKSDVPKDVELNADEDLRQAWLNAGYGDHFLQDSFAAGHLVNKTLVMQWFVDFLNERFDDELFAALLIRMLGPVAGLAAAVAGFPDREILDTMGSADQPGVAGRPLYEAPSAVTKSSHPSWVVTDPQSAHEALDEGSEISGSGVRETPTHSQGDVHEMYLRFLNSTFLQYPTKLVHDHFNESGLQVANGRGQTFYVGGDETLLERSDALGAQVVADAADLSRTAISEILTNGSTAISVDEIWSYVPTSVITPTGIVSLAEWQDLVLHDVWWTDIFPQMFNPLDGDSYLSVVARSASPKMVEIEGELGATVRWTPDRDAHVGAAPQAKVDVGRSIWRFLRALEQAMKGSATQNWGLVIDGSASTGADSPGTRAGKNFQETAPSLDFEKFQEDFGGLMDRFGDKVPGRRKILEEARAKFFTLKDLDDLEEVADKLLELAKALGPVLEELPTTPEEPVVIEIAKDTAAPIAAVPMDASAETVVPAASLSAETALSFATPSADGRREDLGGKPFFMAASDQSGLFYFQESWGSRTMSIGTSLVTGTLFPMDSAHPQDAPLRTAYPAGWKFLYLGESRFFSLLPPH